jgi:hypothetical protein
LAKAHGGADVKWLALVALKGVLPVAVVLTMFGIPYLLATTLWGWFLGDLYRDHFWWFVALVVLVIGPAFIATWKWLTELVIPLLYRIGGMIDRLEGR